QLWDETEPDDYAAAWAGIQAKSKEDAAGKQLLRLKLCESLIDKAAEDPAAHLVKAARLLKVIDDPTRTARPAEVHFMIMRARDLPKPIPPALNEAVQLALRVRKEAEQSAIGLPASGHPYCEQVVPWVQSQIDQADSERQLGQDRLFASGPEEWAKAKV